MDLRERIRHRAAKMRQYGPGRVAPTVTIRKEMPAGAWSQGDPLERLGRFCLAAAAACGADPLFAGRYDGALRLELPPDGCGQRVGIEGGQRWVELARIGPADPLEEVLRALRSGGDQRAALLDHLPWLSALRGRRRAALEVLDLSTLCICDWRGVLAAPQLARLVLAAGELVPGRDREVQQVFPLLLDFDHKLIDAGRASRFLDVLMHALGQGAAWTT
ncbi:MAG: hypothetical protein JXR96_23720 [Deltaproteobacteria bacterium]|nr:hypothetical protein [Deltaproteobacteria bacterium]